MAAAADFALGSSEESGAAMASGMGRKLAPLSDSTGRSDGAAACCAAAVQDSVSAMARAATNTRLLLMGMTSKNKGESLRLPSG